MRTLNYLCFAFILTVTGCCCTHPEPVNRNRDSIPIGTVVGSMLPWAEFVNTVGDPTGTIVSDPPPFDPHKNRWAPCDTRDITGSLLAKVTQVSVTPDLRGVFLRGLNTFSPGDEPVLVTDDHADLPRTNRVAGSFEGDAIKKHTHNLTNATYNTVSVPNTSHHWQQGDGGPDDYVLAVGTGTVIMQDKGQNLDGEETRPRNVAVFYYIKINP